MLAANAARYKELLRCDSPEGVLQAVRAERLTIIDRLVAIAAAASGGRCRSWTATGSDEDGHDG